jgi:signal transduction histidine kinase
MDDAPQNIPLVKPVPATKKSGLTFRTLLALVLLVILVVSGLVIVFSLSYLQGQIMAILPDTSVFAVDSAFKNVLLTQGGFLIAASLVLLVAVYLVIGNLVAGPLRKLAQALDAYASTGERIALPDTFGMPSEIRSLDASFSGFIDRVETAHKRDTENSRVKSDFISTAAHQLRTPLTGIRWALEALEKEALTEEQKALVKSAVDKSRDLVSIVGTLLDISSIESGKYHYVFVPTDVTALASSVARDFTQLAATRGISLFFEGGGEEIHVPSVKIDQERIKWVLNNLVENGIRYTPSGGSVRISLEVGGGRVFVKVKDTGIGIPLADRGNIFERFYRSGNAIAKENAGNGLGLYIARTIAKDHGGDLSFVPNGEGTGTTFILSLPSL